MFRGLKKSASQRVTECHYDSIYLHVTYVLCIKYGMWDLVTDAKLPSGGASKSEKGAFWML